MEVENILLSGVAWIALFGYMEGLIPYQRAVLLVCALMTVLLASIDSRVKRYGTTE